MSNDALTADGFLKETSKPVMSRGLSQVLYNYLPEKTFDYENGECIGKVFELRMEEVVDIDSDRLIASIAKYTNAWGSRIDNLKLRKHLLIFGRPTRVLFNLFPLSFQCLSCERVKTFPSEKDYVSSGGLGGCVECGRNARFEQLYHLLVHECGYASGIVPPKCKWCDSARHARLDLRGSQRASDFRWICRGCSSKLGPVQRACHQCKDAGRLETDEDGSERVPRMKVIPHRANQAFYAHHVTVLNLPTESVRRLKNHPERDALLSEAIVRGEHSVANLLRRIDNEPSDPTADLRELIKGVPTDQRAGLEDAVRKFDELRREDDESKREAIAKTQDAVLEGGWLELLEYLNVSDPTGSRVTLDDLKRSEDAAFPGRGVLVDEMARQARALGFESIELVHEFPVVTAVFGYTRVSYLPESSLFGKTVNTRLQGFRTLEAAPTSQRRRTPVFVDNATTEALLFRLSPGRILRWLAANGHAVSETASPNSGHARAQVLTLSGNIDPFATLDDATPVWKEIFSLVHSVAHLSIRALATMSGLERSGMAEYLFPRVGAFVIYSTKTGVNLGGLATVFHEMLDHLLNALAGDELLKSCVYEPVCSEHWGAGCHACMHLAEMSCKYCNRRLGRHFVYGAPRMVGYFGSGPS